MSVPEPVPGAGAVTQLALKVLGPTADYLGQRLLDSVKAAENMAKVLGKAIAKLGSRADVPGTVPARVVKEFLNEAPFAEDEFMAEYISGVLASSRTPLGRDDTAAVMLAQVGRLSTYAIRSHFVLYVTAREFIKGTEYRLGVNFEQVKIFVPWGNFLASLGVLDEGDRQRTDTIAANALIELGREGLLDASWGKPESLNRPAMPESGIIFVPSIAGANLFMVALGFPLDQAGAFYSAQIDLPQLGIPYMPIPGSNRYVELHIAWRERNKGEPGMLGAYGL